MMYTKGNKESLLDIGNEFISFLQLSDTNTPSYILLDNRINSFYGATFKIDIDTTDKYYMSMEYQKIDVTNSYQNFIDNYDGYCSEYVDYSKSYDSEQMSKYGIKNIFTDNGEFIAFGLHTLYDRGLWICEQGGISCEEETYKQINNANLLPISLRYHIPTGTYMSNQTIPYITYPGIGLPLLSISDNNKDMYDVTVNGINYYFTKDKYSATITIMIENGGANPPLWQSICFGMLGCSDNYKYSIPLYIGGGTQGLKQDYHYCKAGYSSGGHFIDASKTFYGNSITLDMYNPCMSNSNILNISKFNKSNMSNLRVMLPSGKWGNVYSYIQNQKNDSNYLDYPSRYNDCSYVINNSNSNGNNMDMYSITNNNEFGYENNNIEFPALPISIFINSDDEHGFIGDITNIYGISSKSVLGGEVTLNNKKYLCVPCGWDFRLKLYKEQVDTNISKSIGKSVNGTILSDNDVINESLVQYYDNIRNVLYNNQINDKILIRLEE